jgi:hypothetical protein
LARVVRFTNRNSACAVGYLRLTVATNEHSYRTSLRIRITLSPYHGFPSRNTVGFYPAHHSRILQKILATNSKSCARHASTFKAAMSTDNAARLYRGKLEKAVTIFEAGNSGEAQDICCELGNEFRCPRFCQVKAWMLHSRCFPKNYWFAKSSLDQALKICVYCGSYDKATERDLQALADLKASVGKMLEDRHEEYRNHWKAKGREPPSKNEWYEIADGEAGDSAEKWLEVVEDENGNLLSAQEMNENDKQVRQHEEQGERDNKAMNIAMKEAVQTTEEVTQELRQLEISRART